MELAKRLAEIWNPTGESMAALSWSNGDRSGFSPYCKNKFQKSQGCRIGNGIRKPCDGCEARDILPVSSELIQANMNGQKDRLGIYPLVGDKTAWIAGDFDNHNGKKDPKQDVAGLTAQLNSYQIPFSIFSSKSNSGYHVYVFFDGQCEAWKARAMFMHCIEQAGIDIGHRQGRDGSFDCVFPKQDALRDGDTGNLIAIPWSGTAYRETGGGMYLDETTLEPLGGSMEENIDWFLENIEFMPVSDVDVFLVNAGIAKPKGATRPTRPGLIPGQLSEQVLTLIDKCAFLAHCKADSVTLREPDWFYMISILAREYGGPSAIHELSKGYPGYTYQETAEKILQVLDRQPGPISCKAIQEKPCGFNCPGGCPVSYPNHLLTTPRKTEAEIETEAWIADVLLGVSQPHDQLERTARKVAAFYLKLAGDDKESAFQKVRTWNERNTPPLSDDEIDEILTVAVQSAGKSEFNRITGAGIVHLERREYDDGRVDYLLYAEGIDQPKTMLFKDFCSKSKFKETYGELINRLVSVPSGKGSIELWDGLLNGLLAEAAIVHMPDDITEIPVVKEIIFKGVKGYDDEKDMDEKIKDFNNERFIIHNGLLIFKNLNPIMVKAKMSAELSKMTRREVSALLGKMGIKNKNAHRLGDILPRAWVGDAKCFL